MSESIVPLDTDISPESAVSGPILLQSEQLTFLLFNAMREAEAGFSPAGTAIVEFVDCSLTKFGYPNDEAWSAIPRTRGLSYRLYEVQESDWAAEVAAHNRHGFPEVEIDPARHFLALFHDSSFECLATDILISVSNEPLGDIVARLSSKIVAT